MMTVWRRACLSQVTHASSEQQAGVRNFYFSASGQVVQSADVCKMQSALFYAIKSSLFFKSHPIGLQHNRLLHAHCTTNIIKSLIEARPGILRKLWTIACPQEKRSMCLMDKNKTQTEAGGHAKFSFSHHINGLKTVLLHIRSEEKRTPDVSEGDYVEISVLWTCRWMSGFLIIL